MMQTICRTAYKSVTFPLGAAVYAGGHFLSHYIPQSLLSGLANRAPAVLVSLAHRITATLGRSVHLVGAMAVIAAVHQVAKRCSLKHEVQADFRACLSAYRASLENPGEYAKHHPNSAFQDSINTLPWGKIEQFSLKEARDIMRNSTKPENRSADTNLSFPSFRIVLQARAKILLDKAIVGQGEFGEAEKTSLKWLFSNAPEDLESSTEVDLPFGLIPLALDLNSSRSYLKTIPDLIESMGDDTETLTKLLSWITKISFKTPTIEEPRTGEKLAQAYRDQLPTISGGFTSDAVLTACFLAEAGAELNPLLIAVQQAVQENWKNSDKKASFEEGISRYVISKMKLARVKPRSGALADVLPITTLLKDSNVHLQMSEAALKDISLGDKAELIQCLLENNLWELATWFANYEVRLSGRGPSPFKDWNKENCRATIDKIWESDAHGASSLKPEFLMAMLLSHQELPQISGEDELKSFKARSLNTLKEVQAQLNPKELQYAVERLYPGRLADLSLRDYLIQELDKWEGKDPQASKDLLKFINILIDARAFPPAAGAWHSDEKLSAIFTKLASHNNAEKALSWLTGLTFEPSTTEGAPTAMKYVESISIPDELRGNPSVVANAQQACTHLLATLQSDADSFMPLDKLKQILEEVKKLGAQSTLQKAYLDALRLLLEKTEALRVYLEDPQLFKEVMELKFLGDDLKPQHSFLTYLVAEKKFKLAHLYLNYFLSPTRDNGITRGLFTEESLKEAVNYKAQFIKHASSYAGAAAEKPGKLHFVEKSALGILLANTKPEEYSAAHHETLTKLVLAGSDVPADILLFKGAIDWFVAEEPVRFAEILESFYLTPATHQGIVLERVSEDALAKCPKDTNAGALNRCELYAESLKAAYPLLGEAFTPSEGEQDLAAVLGGQVNGLVE